MRKIKFLLVTFFTVSVWSLTAQIAINETFEASALPEGWTTQSYFVFGGSDYNCEGNNAVIHNLYSSNTSGHLTSPTQTSNGDDIHISYSWTARPYSTNAVDYIVYVEYATVADTWILLSEYEVTAETDCTEYTTTIAGADVPSGADFTFRVRDAWNSGDSYHAVDDVHIVQGSDTSVATVVIEGLEVFPNPVNDILTVNAVTKIDTITIFNFLGQEVLRSTPNLTQTKLNTNNLPQGAYIVKIKVGNQTVSYNLIKA